MPIFSVKAKYNMEKVTYNVIMPRVIDYFKTRCELAVLVFDKKERKNMCLIENFFFKRIFMRSIKIKNSSFHIHQNHLKYILLKNILGGLMDILSLTKNAENSKI